MANACVPTAALADGAFYYYYSRIYSHWRSRCLVITNLADVNGHDLADVHQHRLGEHSLFIRARLEVPLRSEVDSGIQRSTVTSTWVLFHKACVVRRSILFLCRSREGSCFGSVRNFKFLVDLAVFSDPVTMKSTSSTAVPLFIVFSCTDLWPVSPASVWAPVLHEDLCMRPTCINLT